MKNNQIINSDVFKIMEEWAPKFLAYDWDNIGLQLGSYNKPVKKVMITLDVVEEVVEEAIKQRVDLIIAHHPLLFKPAKQINTDQPIGRVIKKLLEHDITVYAAHTNLDIAKGGVNDMLCDQLKLESTDVLVETDREPLFKVAVYVPTTHKSTVLDALGENGAGNIGNYSHCSFQLTGLGTFKPLAGSKPFIGNENKLEEVDEVKIEVVAQESKLKNIVQALIDSHPYEEPAYDVYRIENVGQRFGIGRIGTLRNKISLEEFCKHVKTSLRITNLRVTGDLSKTVRKVAVLGGSGEKYIHAAKQKGADVFVTGDMTFHNAQDAWSMGLTVVDAGHYIEEVMKEYTVNYLKDKLANKDIEIIQSIANTDPFQFV